MTKASTSQVMMVRPVQFRFNEETAKNNAFQEKANPEQVAQQRALEEFDQLVCKLKENHINVLVVNDTEDIDTPDSIFPNNWISTHTDGTIVLYPMFAENRRAEVRPDIVQMLIDQFGFNQVIDWSTFVNNNRFLEGTGSIVVDRKNKVAYACLSERTEEKLFQEWGETLGYETITFSSVDENNFPVYHTNVMMAIAENFAVVCLESIRDESERNRVKHALLKEGKEIIEITYEQMNNFGGNMIELKNTKGEIIFIMSQAAKDALRPEQVAAIENQAKIVSSPITTIETNGGGSVRCMIAEIYAPEK